MSQTKKHGRLQSILSYYILYKLRHQPQLIQRIVRPYLGSGLSKHDNAYHTDTYLTSSTMGGPYVDESGDTMTGDLDLDNNKLILGTEQTPVDLYIKVNAAIWKTAGIYRYDNDALANWEVQSLYAQQYYTSLLHLTLNSSANVTGEIILNSWDGAARQKALIAVGGVCDIPRGGDITLLDQKLFTLGTYTDAQRPAAGTAGRVIFNTTSGEPEYDDGTDWRDFNGNVT